MSTSRMCTGRSRRARWCTRWRARLRELGVPHPLHIHGSNLGVAGNIASTLETIDALEGLPAHLTHVQFHAYGTEGPKKFSSAALQLAEAVNANPNDQHRRRPDHVRPDRHRVGRHHAPACAARSRQPAQVGRRRHRMRRPAAASCRSATASRATSTRCNGRSGWRSSCWSTNPWRVVLTTDHPNGGPFTSYPHLIRLLMDRELPRASSWRSCIPMWRRTARCARSRAS